MNWKNYLGWTLVLYIFVVIMVIFLISLSGCGNPATDVGAGFGAGVVTTLNQANAAMEKVNKDIAALNDKSKEIETLLAKDPQVLVNALDPNLGAEIAKLIANAKTIQATGKEVDWTSILIAVTSILGGGSAVNIWKNRKTS